jgi:hypothetical protein
MGVSRPLDRALTRLAAPSAILAPDRSGRAYGVYLNGDRRRRPAARLSPADVKSLESDGALLVAGDGGYVLSAAGSGR